MINYYEILGLPYGAGIAEIKASFRHLAKLYHPDINPDGKEHFTKILRAYETLSDPVLKSSYDYKLNYHQAQTQYQAKSSATKTWRFDERELKRRQYYNDHIRKYARENSQTAETETKKNYNEFKYILFATPLAVLLFLLVMSLANRNRPTTGTNTIKPPIGDTKDPAVFNKPASTGDSPYDAVFGSAKYDTLHDQKLIVKNLTGSDIIVCLFTKTDFIRSFYIENNYFVEVSQLPDDMLCINYSSGSDFDRNRRLETADVTGAFTKDQYFFKSLKAASLNSINELTLVPGDNEGFERINEEEFFKRANNHDNKN